MVSISQPVYLRFILHNPARSTTSRTGAGIRDDEAFAEVGLTASYREEVCCGAIYCSFQDVGVYDGELDFPFHSFKHHL